jgi:hypothetical protein
MASQKRDIVDVRIVEDIRNKGRRVSEIPIVFTGRATDLVSFFEEPIKVHNHQLALQMISSANSIRNITALNNKFRFKIGNKPWVTEELEPGSYEVSDIQTSLEYLMQKQDNTVSKTNEDLKIEISVNEALGKAIIKIPDNWQLDLSIPNSIGQVLGSNKELSSGMHLSDDIIRIQPLTCIFVHCSLVSGSYVNGRRSQSIFHFLPTVPMGHSFVITPNPIVYLEVPNNKIEFQTIRVWLTDQNNLPVDLSGEELTVVLTLRG